MDGALVVDVGLADRKGMWEKNEMIPREGSRDKG